MGEERQKGEGMRWVRVRGKVVGVEEIERGDGARDVIGVRG